MNQLFNYNTAVYYESSSKYPNDHRGVKWTSKEVQFKRFEILCELANDVYESHILDVGCGLGHLTDYLETKNFKGIYKGIDIVDNMIQCARKRKPKYHFQTNDIDSIQEQSIDYVLASGIFAFTNWKDMKNMIEAMFLRARKGIAFNCLRKHSNQSDESLFYPDPETLTEFCRSITPHTLLREDYLENDLTIYMSTNL